jgi:hydroxymethylpyrimidine pyrophosphatase-like HAD family hydrolase
MLTECGISVAMANAAEEVRAAARYHTAGNDDDGVAIVIEKMLKKVYSG